MDEYTLIIARAHQRDLQAQALRNPNRRLRWRRLRTGRATIVALPGQRAAAPRLMAPSYDDAA